MVVDTMTGLQLLHSSPPKPPMKPWQRRLAYLIASVIVLVAALIVTIFIGLLFQAAIWVWTLA